MIRFCLVGIVAIIFLLIYNSSYADEGWKIYYLKGGILPPDTTFKIPYKITNGTLQKIDVDFATIVLTINGKDNGMLEIKIPKNLPYTNNVLDVEDNFIILVDGIELRKNVETKTTCFRELDIPFDLSSQKIELVGTLLPSTIPIEAPKVPIECIDETMLEQILSPRKQIANGILPEDVVCSDGLVLIKKISTNTVACVKPLTAEKLVQRGWGTTTLIETQNTMKTIKVTNTDFTINYTITSGEVREAIVPDVEGGAMILSLQTINDGEITIRMLLVEAVPECQSSEKDYFVLVNGHETHYNVTTTDSYRTLTFKFQKGAEEVEIIKTASCNGMPSSISVFAK